MARRLQENGFQDVKVEVGPDGATRLSGSLSGGDPAKQTVVEIVRNVPGVTAVRQSLFVWEALRRQRPCLSAPLAAMPDARRRK